MGGIRTYYDPKVNIFKRGFQIRYPNMRRCLLWALLFALVGCGKSAPPVQSKMIGRDITWFPLQLGAKSNNLTAFTTALVQEIDRLEHLHLQIVNIDWIRLCPSLWDGEIGAMLTSMTPNLISEEKYTFSDPIVSLGPVLVVPSSSEVTSIAQLDGKIVGVYQYDESVLVAQEYPLIIQLYQSITTILEELKHGVVDAALIPVLDAHALVNHLYAKHLKIISEPLNNKAIRLATLKNKYETLMKHFNQGLKKAREQGVYETLRSTYALDN
jgi:polar amino acid transport system substrate-binding protein